MVVDVGVTATLPFKATLPMPGVIVIVVAFCVAQVKVEL